MVEGVVEFEVSGKLKSYGITRKVLLGDSLIKAVYNDKSIIATYDVKDFTGTMKRLRKAAGDVITSNGKDTSDIIDDLIIEMTSDVSDHIEKTGLKNSSIMTKNNKRQVTVCKYTDLASRRLW